MCVCVCVCRVRACTPQCVHVLMRLCEYSRVSLSGINIVNKQMPRAFMRVLGKGISRHVVQSTHSDSLERLPCVCVLEAAREE